MIDCFGLGLREKADEQLCFPGVARGVDLSSSGQKCTAKRGRTLEFRRAASQQEFLPPRISDRPGCLLQLSVTGLLLQPATCCHNKKLESPWFHSHHVLWCVFVVGLFFCFESRQVPGSEQGSQGWRRRIRDHKYLRSFVWAQSAPRAGRSKFALVSLESICMQKGCWVRPSRREQSSTLGNKATLKVKIDGNGIGCCLCPNCV